MNGRKPHIPESMLTQWQRAVDVAARTIEVPACLVMRTEPPHHAVLVSSKSPGNPYRTGEAFELNSKLYCYMVLQDRRELLVRDAHSDPCWDDNQDLEHGMSFYIGYPLAWPDGALFGTICVLDLQENERAIRRRELLLEFGRLIEADLALLSEVAERRRLERELQASLEELEARVASRTAALTQANASLRAEIRSRKKVETAVRRRECQLQEANTALRVLLANVGSSRHDLEQQMRAHIRDLVLPHLAKLGTRIGEHHPGRCHLDLAEVNLEKITSPLAGKLLDVFARLTPTEIEVAQLVMQGRTTKAIAKALLRETSTIDFHRNNIRKKLGVEGRERTLRTHLLALQK